MADYTKSKYYTEVYIPKTNTYIIVRRTNGAKEAENIYKAVYGFETGVSSINDIHAWCPLYISENDKANRIEYKPDAKRVII